MEADIQWLIRWLRMRCGEKHRATAIAREWHRYCELKSIELASESDIVDNEFGVPVVSQEVGDGQREGVEATRPEDV